LCTVCNVTHSHADICVQVMYSNDDVLSKRNKKNKTKQQKIKRTGTFLSSL
jgi:hypothetical protein